MTVTSNPLFHSRLRLKLMYLRLTGVIDKQHYAEYVAILNEYQSKPVEVPPGLDSAKASAYRRQRNKDVAQLEIAKKMLGMN
ncbi:hypothetical protein JWH16_04430 [Xanthomonas campestris pv. campestris]|uniref:hypothetical protein n=1 Tax=Xanthomonas campestris TaxID=339 RepID=UPI001E3FA9E0|nr:hypothetical protein [Xanthomonas campestris]MCD0253101.1 hypothetical protein [Xanthomonas campestris pv. campestris]